MLIQKTHFAQVPLVVVRKMIAEQTRREAAAQHELATSLDAVEATPEDAQDKSLKKSSKLSPLEVRTLW